MDQVFWIQLIFQPQNSYGPEDFWTKYFFGPKIFGPLIRLELHFFLDATLFGTQSFWLNIYSYNFSNPTFYQHFSMVSKKISEQEIKLFEQEMEYVLPLQGHKSKNIFTKGLLFLPLWGLWSKNFFYKMFLIWSKGFKIDFQNRKWNYPNRKWNHFSHFQASDQKLLLQNASHF